MRRVCLTGLARALTFAILAAPCALGQGSTGSMQPVTNAAPDQNVQAQPERIRVSAQVATMRLLHRVSPVYPQIAQVARIQGTVAFHVIIATDGSVKELQYTAGPPLLMRAAMDAVKQWKYSPFVLNGRAIEMDTSIVVVFALGARMANDALAENPALARRLQLLLPQNVEVLEAAKGYKNIRDFEIALYASRDLDIPFVQLRCGELGGQYCNPATTKKRMNATQTIESFKPGMSKDEVKRVLKAASKEAKTLR